MGQRKKKEAQSILKRAIEAKKKSIEEKEKLVEVIDILMVNSINMIQEIEFAQHKNKEESTEEEQKKEYTDKNKKNVPELITFFETIQAMRTNK